LKDEFFAVGHTASQQSLAEQMWLLLFPSLQIIREGDLGKEICKAYFKEAEDCRNSAFLLQRWVYVNDFMARDLESLQSSASRCPNESIIL
jgi:hypothetical protein